MAEFVICTPMWLENVMVRLGVRGRSARLVHTGIGPVRTRRNVSSITGDGPVAMLGVAGGLQPEVKVGDIVVASEVFVDGSPRLACPSAELVAAALRRTGLTVHVGPIVSVPQLVHGHARDRLAATGALAVDMESGYLAEMLGADRPLAVVRTISDTADQPLLSPAILRRGTAALAGLRRAVPAVQEWAAAVGTREAVLASPRSFCAGVERAIEIVERALERYGAPVYVRRQIVHNAHVVASLEARGAVFVTELDEVPVGSTAVLAAHGVSPAVRAEADERSLVLVDATCPLVAKVHSEVRRYAAADHTVLLIGHADHEEVVGSAGEAPEHVLIIESEADARTVEVPDPARVAYAMQTTLAVDEAERVAAILRSRFPDMRQPPSDDICYATTNRQLALRAIAAECDVVLVVGSANSSNSLRLVEVARRSGCAAYLVEDASALDLRWLRSAKRIGITAGASAPPELVDQLVDALSSLGDLTVREHRATDEDVRFTLPREVA